MDQHHLMLKVSLSSSTRDNYGRKKKVGLKRNISIGFHCME